MTTTVPKLKWYEHFYMKRAPLHYFGRAMGRKEGKLNKDTRKAREELSKRGGKLRYHCTDLYDGQLLMFWVHLTGGVRAGSTCEVPAVGKLTLDPFARNGMPVAGVHGPNPNRWGGFDARLSSKAINDAKGVAIPILEAYNAYQQEVARRRANQHTLKGTRKSPFSCDQYKMIGIPLIVRRDTKAPSSHESKRGIEFGQHNLQTVPRVAPTKFVEGLLLDIKEGAKASLAKEMERFYSSASPSKSDAAMQGAGYLQESHVVVIDRKVETLKS